MGHIWTFIQALTWRDWIAILGLLVLPLGALNAFFGLRTRYKDWQGTKTKNDFSERLRQLNDWLNEAADFHSDLNKFILRAMNDAVLPIELVIAALFFFISGYALSEAFSSRFAETFSGAAIVCLFWSLNLVSDFLNLLRRVREPFDFAQEITNFIDKGKTNNVISESDKTIIREIAHSGYVNHLWARYMLEELDKEG